MNLVVFTNLTTRLGNTGRQVVLNVMAPPVHFSGVQWQAGGRLSITLQGESNRAYSIELSTNLTTWTNVLSWILEHALTGGRRTRRRLSPTSSFVLNPPTPFFCPHFSA